MMQDFTTLRRGVLREILPPPKADSSSAGHQVGSEQHEQCITLNNERFTVPELLFNPSDVGIIQVGSQKHFPTQFGHSFLSGRAHHGASYQMLGEQERLKNCLEDKSKTPFGKHRTLAILPLVFEV